MKNVALSEWLVHRLALFAGHLTKQSCETQERRALSTSDVVGPPADSSGRPRREQISTHGIRYVREVPALLTIAEYDRSLI
jgi:hypothetical protein